MWVFGYREVIYFPIVTCLKFIVSELGNYIEGWIVCPSDVAYYYEFTFQLSFSVSTEKNAILKKFTRLQVFIVIKHMNFHHHHTICIYFNLVYCLHYFTLQRYNLYFSAGYCWRIFVRSQTGAVLSKLSLPERLLRVNALL